MRAARPPTEERLIKSALHYLDRYGSSVENLRRVLARKVRRAAEALDLDPCDYDGIIDRVVERCRASGLVDDAAFAESKIASERRKGRSARRIGMTLAAKGIDRDLAGDMLSREGEAEELRAAMTAARKRRLGPWRSGEADHERIGREIAVLARQGFTLVLARRIVEADSIEALQQRLDDSSFDQF
jgi:regulatory protein